MNYGITEKQINKIIERWGNDFYLKILRDIEIYSKKWALSDFIFFEHYSINAIFYCKSEVYGECVLKVGGNEQDYEFAAEYNVLREYNGWRYVKVYESDIDIQAGKKIMLIERVIPGQMLSQEKSLAKRLTVFSELFNGLHIEPKNFEIYETYEKWIYEAVQECEKSQKDLKGILEHVNKAKEICFEICKTYNIKMLLHIDIYSDNIVGGDGKYKIIDPKGVIGDPIFDTAQFIFNECCENRIEPENIKTILDYLEKSLNIPQKILRQCFYIETVRFISYYAAMDGADEWDIERVKFAEKVMNEK